MEINVPTAAPFFSGLPNQIMYCISTPNPHIQNWNTHPSFNVGEQKKIENQHVVVPTTTQYYCNVSAPQSYQATNNVAVSVPVNNNFDESKVNRDYEEGEKNFQCTICNKKFRQKGTLQQHERIHLEMKPYQCSFENCEKKFRQKAILNQHMRIHCDASSQLVYRNLGQNGILWPQNVPYPDEIPNQNKNEVDEKVSLPQIIHSVFGTLNDDIKKDETEESVKGTMPQYVRCPICQQEFKQKSTLVQRGCIHIESRPYSCLVVNCGRRFRQQSHLVQHTRIHENSKPYKCPYCDRCFRQRTILNQHIRLHTNEKPYKCKTCFKQFRQQAILSSHEKSHMSLTLGCPLPNCKKRFVSENDLKKHIEVHMNPSLKPKKQSTSNKNTRSDISLASSSYPMYNNFNSLT